MRSLVSASQLPNGTLCLTHSTLFTCHDRLVGCSIQVVYDTVAHTSRTRKGAAISRTRRRRRLRLTAGPPGCSPPAAPWTADAESGGVSAASGGALTPEPEPGRRRSRHPITSQPQSSTTGQRQCYAAGCRFWRDARVGRVDRLTEEGTMKYALLIYGAQLVPEALGAESREGWIGYTRA